MYWINGGRKEVSQRKVEPCKLLEINPETETAVPCMAIREDCSAIRMIPIDDVRSMLSKVRLIYEDLLKRP